MRIALAAAITLACAGASFAQASSTPEGTLILEGESIKALRLSGPRAISLEKPGPREKLPVGTYTVTLIRLADSVGNVIECVDPNRPVRITEGEPAVLKLGGPLRNTVGVARKGGKLDFSYALVGIGGETYPPNSGPVDPPAVLIRKDGKEIGGGNFRYG